MSLPDDDHGLTLVSQRISARAQRTVRRHVWMMAATLAVVVLPNLVALAASVLD